MRRFLPALALLCAAFPAAAQDAPAGAANDSEYAPAGAATDDTQYAPIGAAADESLDPMVPAGNGSGIDLRGEVAILSDYRFRGISRSDEDPALQAGLTLSHPSGFYAGARGTSLSGEDAFRRRGPSSGRLGDAEFDVHAGWSGPIGNGFEADGGIQYYVFAGGEGDHDHVEPYASLSYLIGPLFATAGAKYAPAQRGTGDEDLLYLFGQIDVAIPFQPWRITASGGRQDWGIYGDYWTWSIGVEHRLQVGALPAADIGLSYVDTDLESLPGQDAGLVGSLRLRF